MAYHCSFTLAVFIGSGVSILLAEWVLDGSFIRFALVVTTPFLFCVSLVSLLIGFYGPLSNSLFVFSSSVSNSSAIYLWCTSLSSIFLTHFCSRTLLSHRLGPVAQYNENSKYYSAIRPRSNKEVDEALPHITIEMPVFKESLKETMCVPCNFLVNL